MRAAGLMRWVLVFVLGLVLAALCFAPGPSGAVAETSAAAGGPTVTNSNPRNLRLFSTHFCPFLAHLRQCRTSTYTEERTRGLPKGQKGGRRSTCCSCESQRP